MGTPAEVELIPWNDFFRRDGTPCDVASLKDGNPEACLCQIGPCDEGIVARADEDDVVVQGE